MRAEHSGFAFSQRARGSRWLSYALLLLFVYGSTAEAVHHHGVAGPTDAAATSAISDSGSVSNSSTPSAPRKSGAAGECLVCQFQQNLSSAEIYTPLLVLAPAVTDQQFLTTPTLLRSTTISTPHGRGPPSIS